MGKSEGGSESSLWKKNRKWIQSPQWVRDGPDEGVS